MYGQDGKLLAVLDNADAINYDLKHNDLWTGGFSLPTGDPKNAHCAAHNLIRLPDGPRKTGLFRIVGMPSDDETAQGGMKEYSVEHVMATLLDDILFGYHEVGGEGVSTRDVMEYILARQTVVRWQLGTVEFEDYFQYHFENVSLLSALLSMGEVLSEEYTWVWDTDTSPWTVSLVKADSEAGCGIYYGRNLQEIKKSWDASALVTRLYPLGYGEGVNQLTIRDVNNGAAYIDADTIGTWGVKSNVWTDTRIQDAATLKARAEAVLEGYKNPYFSYTAKAVDLLRLTGYSWDDFMPGKLVRVRDGEHGINFDARIVEISKGDVRGDPGDIDITIANAPRDAADSINTLADRVGIGELYSQGATNLFAIPFADNADASHPAKMRVYVPQGLVRINKMLLSWQLAPFRAYETGAAAGGATQQTSGGGGSSTATSSSTDTVTYTSETGGACTATSREMSYSPTGRNGVTGQAMQSDGEGGYEVNTYTGRQLDPSSKTYSAMATGSAGGHSHTVNGHTHGMAHTHDIDSHSHTVESHSHSMNYHTHSLGGHQHTVKWGHRHQNGTGDTTGGVYNYDDLNPYSSAANGATGEATGSTGTRSPGTTGVALTTGGAQSGGSGVSDTGSASPGTDSQGEHTHSVADHVHRFDHHHLITTLKIPALTVDVPNHGHNVKIPGHSHTVEIPSHTHSVTIPSHEHQIVYGIFEGGSAQNVSIVVDGDEVPASAITGRELDVSPWLDKDENGKITRGTWHEIWIVPDGLTRIEANLFAQCFVQSVGGGDY